MIGEAITRPEREDLQRLIRQREKVLKSAAKQRSAELLADFENQMGSEYFAEDDPVWNEVTDAAQQVVAKAQQQIATRCRELGIPKRFAPSLNLTWSHRGYDNALQKRRNELRRMAQTQIEAIESKAIVQIEMSCLEAQTALAIAGLTSEAAKQFVEKLPTIEALMPPLSLSEIAGDVEPPVAEQLVTPGALRQRRYRERLAKRDVTSLPRNGDAGGDELDIPPELRRVPS